MEETFGEDGFLAGEIGYAYMKGWRIHSLLQIILKLHQAYKVEMSVQQ